MGVSNVNLLWVKNVLGGLEDSRPGDLRMIMTENRQGVSQVKDVSTTTRKGRLDNQGEASEKKGKSGDN